MGKFQAVIFRRIMARGYIYRAVGFLMYYLKRDDRRRGVAFGQEDFYAVRGKYFGCGCRKFSRVKAGIVADYYEGRGLLRRMVRLYVTCYRLRCFSYV